MVEESSHIGKPGVQIPLKPYIEDLLKEMDKQFSWAEYEIRSRQIGKLHFQIKHLQFLRQFFPEEFKKIIIVSFKDGTMSGEDFLRKYNALEDFIPEDYLLKKISGQEKNADK